MLASARLRCILSVLALFGIVGSRQPHSRGLSNDALDAVTMVQQSLSPGHQGRPSAAAADESAKEKLLTRVAISARNDGKRNDSNRHADPQKRGTATYLELMDPPHVISPGSLLGGGATNRRRRRRHVRHNRANNRANNFTYVTFVDDGAYMMYATVLLKSMFEQRHKYPTVLMLRKSSPLVPKVPAILEAMHKAGWNVEFKIFNPMTLDVPDMALESWKECWQRIQLFALDPAKFPRFVHLDADMLVLKSLDGMLEGRAAEHPASFARRMGACKSWKDIDTSTLVTNLFTAKPDLGIYQYLEDYITDHTGEVISDEAVMIQQALQSVREVSLDVLSPQTSFYYDCFMNQGVESLPDRELRERYPDIPDNIHALHLGVPGKTDIAAILEARDVNYKASEYDDQGRQWLAQTLRHWYGLYQSADVQAVLAAADSSFAHLSTSHLASYLALD